MQGKSTVSQPAALNVDSVQEMHDTDDTVQ